MSDPIVLYSTTVKEDVGVMANLFRYSITVKIHRMFIPSQTCVTVLANSAILYVCAQWCCVLCFAGDVHS